MLTMSIEGHLTADEAASLLGVKRESVYSYARRLPGFPQPTRVGRTVLWKRADLLKWRAEHPTRKART